MTDYLGPLTLYTTSASTYQLVTWRASAGKADLEVVVRAASAATLTAAIEALVAQLTMGNTYAHTFPGSTSVMLYRVAGVSGLTVDEETGPLAFWALVKVTILLTGYPAGALTALYSAEAVTAPASLSLATLLGTNPTPLDVTIDDSSGNDLHCVLAALAPTAVSDTRWKVLASALTWTSMTDPGGSPADCWGAVSRTTTSASWQTAPLDTSMYPAGKYRLYVRAKQSAGTGQVKDSQNDSAVAITRTSHHLTVVGDLDLPVADTASGTAANLTLSVASDGSNTLTVNAFLLIPLSWGAFTWHSDVVTGEIDQLDVGPSGIYMDSVTDTTYLRGGILTPKRLAAHVGTMVTTASPTGDTWPATWYRSSVTEIAAAGGYFACTNPTGNRYARLDQGAIYITPGEWYELNFTRNITSRTSGTFYPSWSWYDVDGNLIRTDAETAVGAADAGDTAVTYYRKAPPLAARVNVLFYTTTGTLVATWKSVVLRRCPLRLIIVAEDSAGTLSSNTHAVAVTVKYVPRYEVSR